MQYKSGNFRGLGLEATKIPSGINVKIKGNVNSIPGSLDRFKLYEAAVEDKNNQAPLSFKDIPVADSH